LENDCPRIETNDLYLLGLKTESGEESLWYNVGMTSKNMNEIDWDACEIQEIDQLSNSVVVCANDETISVDVPPTLFKALIKRGEQNFIDSDPEHFDGGMI